MAESDDQSGPRGPIYPFVLLSSHRILVCQVCGFTSVADEAKSHLLARHRDIASEHRQTVLESIQRIPNILRKQSDLEEWQYPDPASDPIPHLLPPKLDGRRCRTCGRVYRHVQQMQTHCFEEHQWVNPRGRGRPTTGCATPQDELPWIEGVPCQRFFSSRGGSQWFEVGRNTYQLGVCRPQKEIPVLNPLEQLESLGAQAHAHLSDVLERERGYRDRANQARISSKTLDPATFATTSAWLGGTQWQSTYRDVRRHVLPASTRLPGRLSLMRNFVLGQGLSEGDPDIESPKEDEQKASCNMGALHLVIDRCENTVRHTGHIILCWLLSTIINTTLRSTYRSLS